MYRISPSRNQRSKGVKVKHILQICLLLAVSFWLIYQVKHSHDKKKEFDESDAKTSLHGGTGDDFIKLGRKYIRPREDGPINKNERRDETHEEEEETEEIKNGEDGSDEKEVVEKEEEEMDEPEQGKSDTEDDKEEDLVDDEKEREDGDENDIEEKDSEDGSGQIEKESDKEQDDMDTHEAREENYKADDASSAVTHETETLTTGNGNLHEQNTTEHSKNISEQEKKENNSEETGEVDKRADLDVEGGERETAKENNQVNATTSETKENTVDNSGNGSSSNNTETQESRDHLENSNISNEVATGGSQEQNATQNELKLPSDSNGSSLDVDNKHIGSNSTDLPETISAGANPENFSNSSYNTESFTSEELRSEVEENDTVDAEKSDTDDGKDEVLESEMNENPEEVPHDFTDLSDSSNSLDMKDVRTDLETLPEIRTEGTGNEDVAAE